jgi:acetyl-CoA carboxylase carboxyltransferase component
MMQTRAPMQAKLVQWLVNVGDTVHAGKVMLVLEAMKMEHEMLASVDGVVVSRHFEVGDMVETDNLLLMITPTALDLNKDKNADEKTLANHLIPAALNAMNARMQSTKDEQRPEAVAKRHALGLRTARENISDLCDIDASGKNSFLEYGAMAIAAQSSRRTYEDLVANTPADGMITGIASINGANVPVAQAQTVVMAYDATVLAGTQGLRNHQKTDRMIGIALQRKLPVVLFAEGGGGRPGDTDASVVAGLHTPTFASFARLSGHVPVIGITAGRCFAGNAALLGCCDVIIATTNSNIGMGGPAMVEGGGLGVFKAEQIGPSSIQHSNGVIDILVENEKAAVATAKQYLSFFQGAFNSKALANAPDTLATRQVVPENRLRVYDSLAAIRTIVDVGSLLLLRPAYGVGVHTCLARIDGQAVGIIANNPLHLGGAIDADACRKMTRFLRMCNANHMPIISLVDTPGFMVGPETEAQGQVRAAGDLFIASAQLTVPFFSIILRKGYGLGAMAMTAGSFHRPLFTVAWPSAEFGAMGLEGAVRLGFRKELDAAPNDIAREKLFQQLLGAEISKGSAINMAEHLEIDAVIDPAETRRWLVAGLQTQQHKTTPWKA